MHKRIVNQATIELAISPVGPLLIKASDPGADPTKPDMEFVETYHAGGRSVYLPGSSLKGAMRAHCERIVRTIGGAKPNAGNVWTCNPLIETEPCRNLKKRHPEDTAAIYRDSCTVCQLFGSTDIAAHARIADAYPVEPADIQLEERNGVAIDRIYGSVVHGRFNFQVLTAGEFITKITVKNFTTAQLALIALAIRDFAEQRVGLGYAKSRGLGQVDMKVTRVEIRYPTTIVEEGQLQILGAHGGRFGDNCLLGAGDFVNTDERQAYGFPESDTVEVTVHAQPDAILGTLLVFEEPDTITALWRGCVQSWRETVSL